MERIEFNYAFDTDANGEKASGNLRVQSEVMHPDALRLDDILEAFSKFLETCGYADNVFFDVKKTP